MQHKTFEAFEKEANQYTKILQKYKKNGTVFVDPHFHPKGEISENPNRFRGFDNSIVWHRVDAFFKAPLFQTDLINPNYIKQGNLGDCYFLSALSRIASQPRLVPALFEIETVEKQMGKVENSIDLRCGAVVIKFFAFGKQTKVLIDTQIPFTRGTRKPFLSRPSDIMYSPWFCLVEKAYAKLTGSYSDIVGGLFFQAIYSLYGYYPSHKMVSDLLQKEKDGKTSAFDRILKYQTEGCAIGASIDINDLADTSITEDTLLDLGLCHSHSYLIQKVKKFDDLELFCLRNPWGEHEWLGDWSDTSELWTPSLKAKLCLQESEDGTFWMNSKDFFSYFTRIDVSQPIPHNYHARSFKRNFEKGPLDGINPQELLSRDRKEAICYEITSNQEIPDDEQWRIKVIIEKKSKIANEQASLHYCMIFDDICKNQRCINSISAYSNLSSYSYHVRSPQSKLYLYLHRLDKSDITEELFVTVISDYDFEMCDVNTPDRFIPDSQSKTDVFTSSISSFGTKSTDLSLGELARSAEWMSFKQAPSNSSHKRSPELIRAEEAEKELEMAQLKVIELEKELKEKNQNMIELEKYKELQQQSKYAEDDLQEKITQINEIVAQQKQMVSIQLYHQSQETVRNTQAQLQEVQNRLSQIQNEYSEKQKNMVDINIYNKLKTQASQSESDLIDVQNQLNNKVDEIRQTQIQLQSMTSLQQKTELELISVKNELNRITTEFTNKQNQMVGIDKYNELQENSVKLNQQIQSLENQLKDTNATLSDNLTSLTTQKQHIEKELNELTEQYNHVQQELYEKETELLNATKQNEENDNELKQLRLQITLLETEIKDNALLAQQIDETESRAKDMQNKLEETQNKLTEAENRATETEEKLKDTENRASEAEDELNQLRLQLASSEADKARNVLLAQQIQETENRVKEAESRVSESENKLADAENELNQLKLQLASSETDKARNVLLAQQIKETENRMKDAEEQFKETENRAIESENKLAEAENELNQLRLQLASSEADKEQNASLAQQIKDTENRAAEAENRAVKAENELLMIQDQLQQLNEKQNQMIDITKYNELEQRSLSIENELKDVTSKLNGKEEEFNEERKQLINIDQFTQSEEQRRQIEEQLKAVTQKLKEVQEELNENRKELFNRSNNEFDSESEVRALKLQLLQLQEDFTESQAQLLSERKLKEDLEKEIQQAKSDDQIELLKLQLNETEQRANNAENELQILKEQLNEKNEITQNDSLYKEFEDRAIKAESELQTFKDEYNEKVMNQQQITQEQFNESEEKRKEAENQLAKLNNERSQLISQLEEFRQNGINQQLKETQNQLKETEQQFENFKLEMVNTILKAVENDESNAQLKGEIDEINQRLATVENEKAQLVKAAKYEISKKDKIILQLRSEIASLKANQQTQKDNSQKRIDQNSYNQPNREISQNNLINSRQHSSTPDYQQHKEFTPSSKQHSSTPNYQERSLNLNFPQQSSIPNYSQYNTFSPSLLQQQHQQDITPNYQQNPINTSQHSSTPDYQHQKGFTPTSWQHSTPQYQQRNQSIPNYQERSMNQNYQQQNQSIPNYQERSMNQNYKQNALINQINDQQNPFRYQEKSLNSKYDQPTLNNFSQSYQQPKMAQLDHEFLYRQSQLPNCRQNNPKMQNRDFGKPQYDPNYEIQYFELPVKRLTFDKSPLFSMSLNEPFAPPPSFPPKNFAKDFYQRD